MNAITLSILLQIGLSVCLNSYSENNQENIVIDACMNNDSSNNVIEDLKTISMSDLQFITDGLAIDQNMQNHDTQLYEELNRDDELLEALFNNHDSQLYEVLNQDGELWAELLDNHEPNEIIQENSSSNNSENHVYTTESLDIANLNEILKPEYLNDDVMKIDKFIQKATTYPFLNDEMAINLIQLSSIDKKISCIKWKGSFYML